MSNQDPPFGSNPPLSGSTGDRPLGEEPRKEGVIPSDDAAKLREAGNTVREDFNAALETARSDFRTLADTAKRDLSAVKDEAVNQFQSLRGQAGSDAQSLKAQAGDQLNTLKDQAQGQIHSLKSQAETQIGETAGRVKAYASEQAGHLADQARSFATEQKDLAARQFGGVVDSVSKVADELQSSQQGSAVAGYAQDFAGSLRGLADSLQNNSVDQLFGAVQDFGKRQPLAFLGIAALTGFAASRFILASRRRDPSPVSSTGAYRAGGYEPNRYGSDRAFDDDVLSNQGYGSAGRTDVELDRSRTGLGETGTATRGVGDNGRI